MIRRYCDDVNGAFALAQEAVAAVRYRQRRLGEAHLLYKDVLSASRRTLGLRHPATIARARALDEVTVAMTAD